MLSRRTEEILNKAGRFAFEAQHEYCTLEHVLWALLDDSWIREIVDACSASPALLRSELEDYLKKEVPKAEHMPPAPTPDAAEVGETREPPVATLGIQRLIQRAVFHVQSSGKDEVQPHDLFVAFYQAKDSYALYILQRHNIDRLDVLNYISHGIAKREDFDPKGAIGDEEGPGADGSESPESAPPSRVGDGGKRQRGENDPLALYCVNLNELVKKQRIDPLIGRASELDRVVQTLCRRRKNNPILVGEAGVGKTALAEGLAYKIVKGEVPELLKHAEVYGLDLGSLLAGAKFRGDFEQRLKRVLSALIHKREKGGFPVLFIDEIHTIIGAGAVSGGALDAANLIKPFLSRGEIRCIGSTTYTEYRNVFEKDHALARRFQKIDVVEPTSEETVQILKGLRENFEKYHAVTISDGALRAAVDLSVKHLAERFLPDKAIDLIDEAGARARLLNKSTIDVLEIEEIVTQVARIPSRSVSSNQKSRLKALDGELKMTIFGQDHAIDALTTAIRLARSGLRSGDKPMGSFLFCGPTGVGKTELAKQLSHSLGVPFLRFDMSEYMEKHTVSRLIGAPPGYVGYDQAGLLTEAMRKTPFAIILLDEIEKAHPDVWNILLQVMDHGTLTDNYGRKADFKNAIIIMTSNVGARDMERKPLGMSGALSAGNPQKEVERTFSPEFRNRLDGIIYFNALDSLTIAQVVGKQIYELESQLLQKNVEIEISAEAREWLAHKGYDRTMGARPMARLIQDKLRKPLSEEILFGKLENGGRVKVSIKEGSEEFTFEFAPRRGEDPELESHGASSKMHPDG